MATDKTHIKRLASFILLLFAFLLPLTSQPFSAERTGGVYYAYPVSASQRLDIPEGYEPFYISHYGRHGSRWLPSAERYEWVMAQFQDDSNLTPLGKSVKRRLKKICRNARGKAGMLTPLGVRQHRGIARRMAKNYPEVFIKERNDKTSLSDDTRILARSSTSPRCRASMLAFISELPVKNIVGETNPAYMAYINNESDELKALTARTKRQPTVSVDRFVGSLFIHPTSVSEPLKLLSELHTIACDMQDIPLNISLWDIFTEEEMLAVHAANNERMTICNGDTAINEGIPARSSIALWQNIEQEADDMIASDCHGASLRFGHDTALYRLLTLLGLQLPGTGMEDIIPMAANLQMVFLKHQNRNTTLADDILVAFLLNETSCPLKYVEAYEKREPQQKATEIGKNQWFYRWSDVKLATQARIHRLEHLRQLSALNTMVGTAPANTRTAGLFGKGSEEHGQTLPAVLVPNGQTFWTPQTQQTEQKCIAPYYYQDTLFQGLRASHWLVGGCTQDYGSFTVSAYRENQKEGTPFHHADEISHPYYYAVNLPVEQLKLELTGLSHSAILRITPLSDGPVNIVVRANSDEREGGVELDTDKKLVYGHNPVHRIYQGWGERAGFSGHFLLSYEDAPIESGSVEQGIRLTFNGLRGKPIELRMATSFTSREGVERNLLAEAASLTFGQMEQQCIDLWTERFHTIDIDDPDTARVNQFYGALYRASFLPREMSDVDGGYPRFASAESLSRGRVKETRYGDFSMWDTYRALHPLLCIIAPEMSGQMMSSIVGMAEEGGWLPIFPCWNSYTAAMIGDHCASALADACVKGIGGFDIEKAYRFMRKNAFEQPATFEEYKNGMGRRALTSYLQYGYIPLEDSVKEAFHQQEQTSRTLEYAYDDFCVAQVAKALGKEADYKELIRRSGNWRNVINPSTGWADGRYADGRWLGNADLVHRQPYITEGATCHYAWYVPQDVPALIQLMGGEERFVQRLDSMFSEGRYWHGNEPCHQIAWLYSLAGQPRKTHERVTHILQTEYNDSPGGLSGNDDAGQMSAWQVFAHLGFYPVCPGTPQYVLGGTQFQKVTLNLPAHSGNGETHFTIRRASDSLYRLNGTLRSAPTINHSDIVCGGELTMP